MVWKPGSKHSVSSSDRKSTRLNSSHLVISYAVFCLKKTFSLPQPGAASAPHIGRQEDVESGHVRLGGPFRDDSQLDFCFFLKRHADPLHLPLSPHTRFPA